MSMRLHLPSDGWYHLVPRGEFPHASGVVQVLDALALTLMANRFTRESQANGFLGLRVDYDHFGYNESKPAEAAGWIASVVNRSDGLWGRIHWTDEGEAAVRGGRYRFLSPAWLHENMELAGLGKARPVRLDSAGLTNTPNLKGMMPVAGGNNPNQSATVVINRAHALRWQTGRCWDECWTLAERG